MDNKQLNIKSNERKINISIGMGVVCIYGKLIIKVHPQRRETCNHLHTNQK